MHKITAHRAVGLAALALATALACTLFAGCSSASIESTSDQNAAPSEPAVERQLEGKELNIYCGAGMTDPFQKISDAFAEETGCKMNVTFANAAQIQTQINTTQQGDFFIAGSADELKPVEAYVASSTDLVKHIPVLAVPSDNPKAVSGLADLAGVDRLLTGDPESTPIGKIAQKALSQAGLWDQLMSANVITTTTTAPQIATALVNGEGDAGIVWKENAKVTGVAIVDTSDLDDFVKTVPAAELSCAADADAVKAFSEFLLTDAAQSIWAEFGYEQV
ncbi:MAG TPA: molybdate ABC transporter substrate-binding protein [Candidatus Gordonibacter avicola]|nr:molybdate ABC transporter substrate-binding protein [Candidatus Gordonibacter avicola]